MFFCYCIQPEEMSPEEKRRRQEKVEVIKKMLSEAPLNQSSVSSVRFCVPFS